MPGHIVHAVPPSVPVPLSVRLTRPAAQARQLRAPWAGEKWPIGHLVQVDSVARDWPAGQSVQVDAAPLATVPGGQLLQLDAPLVLMWFDAQRLHTVLPASSA